MYLHNEMQILVATCITMDKHQKQSWESNRRHRTAYSTLRMRSCRYSLSLRLSIWYQMPISNACKMVLLGDLLQHWGEAIPYFCFSLDFWKGGRWGTCFPVRLFPRNRKKKLEMYTRWFYLWHSSRTVQSIIFKQHCVHTFSSEVELVLLSLQMMTARLGESKWLVSFVVKERSWVQIQSKVCHLPITSQCLVLQVYSHLKLKDTFSHSANIYWASNRCWATCWGHSNEQDIPFHCCHDT